MYLLNYWLFQKCKILFLLLKRALGIWAWKNSLCKKDLFFAFCVYKNVSQKRFLHINVNNNKYHYRKTTCTFIYIKKAKKLQNLYMYTKIQTLFKKQVNLRYVFIYKSQTLSVTRFFTKIKKLAFIWIKKAWHFALREVFI